VISCRVQENFFNRKYDIWIFDYQRGNSKVLNFKTGEWKPHAEGYLLPDPTLTLDLEHMNALADAMVEADVLPKAFNRNVQELGAIDKHLQDMRRLVFKKPDEKWPMDRSCDI